MIAAVAFLVLGQDSLFGKFHSRKEFSAAMQKIDRGDGWSKAKVRDLMGQPDDVWISSDPKQYISMPDGEVWCYGTNGHHTLPTLGSVSFRGDKVLFANYSRHSPSPAVIPEEELRKDLRAIHKFQNLKLFDDHEFSLGDPLYRIKAANALIPLGKEKAVAVLREYSQIVPMWSEDQDSLFWLVRSVFRGKKPGYNFPVPHIGAVSPGPPSDLSVWPTYPVINTANFPFLVYFGATLGGYPEQFDSYVEGHASDWDIVDNKLIPPNDPFTLFDEVMRQKGFETENLPRIKRAVVNNILRAIRNVVKLKTRGIDVTPEEVKRLHEQFLRFEPTWDNRLGLYVRGDGTYDKDPGFDYQQTTMKFPSLKNLDVEVTIGRTGETEVDFSSSSTESGIAPIKPAVMEVVDVDADQVVGTFAVNVWSSGRNSKKEMLELAPHSPIAGGMGSGSGFDLPLGHKVKLILTYEGKSYESKVWVP